MAIDGVYQKRVMNLTDDDIYHIKGSKKPKNTVFSKAQQPGQEKMDVWAFFSLGLESIYSWTKKFTYVIIILMIDLEFGYGKEMGSRQLGEIQLCFLFVCIFEFFCVFMVVLSRLFWPE